MRIEELRVQHLRCFETARLAPAPGWNWLVGANGAGKSSLLEAVYLLSHGRSFRSGGLDTLVQRGSPGFSVHARVASASGQQELGMARETGAWRLRLNGTDQNALTAIFERCAVLCFEPGTHSLIGGAADGRRRFLDWGVFHVEHSFFDAWRGYRRALRQRNALLKSRRDEDQLSIWEAELGAFAESVERARKRYIDLLQPCLRCVAAYFLPELGVPRLQYRAGWDTQRPLVEVLAEQRHQDLAWGHTRMGPHRADWRLTFERAPDRDYLSRGQIKLAALACVLAQADLFAQTSGEWPILCLDDPTSELDAAHQELVYAHVLRHPVQVWATATGIPDHAKDGGKFLFHVEQGTVRPVLAAGGCYN